MKTGYYVAEVTANGDLKISAELKSKLQLKEGEKVEVLVKKIISKKELNSVSENPLYEFVK